MNDDLRKLEPTLRLYEDEIRGIEKKREELENEILRMQSELKELASKRAAWLRIAAVTKDGVGLSLTDEERQYVTTGGEKINAVPPDLCKGEKLVEGAEAYLTWRKEPATQAEVMKGMREGGFTAEYVSFENSLRSAMLRSGKFRRYKNAQGKYVWALLEWVNEPADRNTSESNAKPNLTVVGGSEAQAKTG